MNRIKLIGIMLISISLLLIGGGVVINYISTSNKEPSNSTENTEEIEITVKEKLLAEQKSIDNLVLKDLKVINQNDEYIFEITIDNSTDKIIEPQSLRFTFLDEINTPLGIITGSLSSIEAGETQTFAFHIDKKIYNAVDVRVEKSSDGIIIGVN